MVRIVDYKERESEDGKVFFALELQGGIELVKSQSTNSFYATARKTSVTSTFNEATCKALIGTELPGRIEKQECESFDYTIADTGEVIELSHRYQYIPDEPSENEGISSSTVDDFLERKTPIVDFAQAELV